MTKYRFTSAAFTELTEAIFYYEVLNNICYLQAIDLAKSDRRLVMNEVAYIGITAGSLFPGLDGACEELTERNFER